MPVPERATPSAVAQPVPPELENFHSWAKAKEAPHYISSYLDGLCRNPTPGELYNASQNPHLQKFLFVYVNRTGKEAMLKGGPFPVGSVIVKEKLAELRHTRQPFPSLKPRPNQRGLPVAGLAELSTVMIKRAKGFNPQCGDWEFAVLDKTGENVIQRGKIEKCQSCHVSQAKQDFVFRSYVKPERTTN